MTVGYVPVSFDKPRSDFER